MSFRPQTAQEAFLFIQDLVSRLPWSTENSYQLSLPKYPQFEILYENKNFSEDDKKEFYHIFLTEIYDVSKFEKGLNSLYEAEPIIKSGIEKLAFLEENWGFKIMERYEVLLTLYGPGGDYNYRNGVIRTKVNPEAHSVQTPIQEIILHEIVHIGIEENIIKKYKLLHWEKERLVDLICYHCLKEVLPNYRIQKNGNAKIDPFLNEDVIKSNLPSAIEKFIECHPRSSISR